MTLTNIKEAIEQLPKRQQTALLSWLESRKEAEWDAEIATDFSSGGRGLALLETVKAGIRERKFKPMGNRRPGVRG
jgi:hypothetical protein